MKLHEIRALIQEYDMLPRGKTVLCAVSGGADSVCLLHLLTQLAAEYEIQLIAAHYNHLLRGSASEEDAAFVSALCASWGIPCEIGRGDVAAEAAAAGQGLEETARSMRYGFLEETADKRDAACIATAHNANDNAETMLMRLVRGTGLLGLCGIPPRRGRIVRPLLQTDRRDILSYLQENQLLWREDQSNADHTYTRNRVRHEMLPLLQTLNPSLISTLTASARSLRQDSDYLTAAAARQWSLLQPAEGNRVLPRGALLRLPAALAARVIYRGLEEIGVGRRNIGASHIEAVLTLAQGDDPSGRVTLPRGAVVQRVYEELLFARESDFSDTFTPLPLNQNGETAVSGLPWRIVATPCQMPEDGVQTGRCFYLKPPQGAQIRLRPRQAGDEIHLSHRGGGKSIKKWLIDAKVPRYLRELIPVLEQDGSLLAVAGLGPDERGAAAPGTPALKIETEGIIIDGTGH